MDATERAAHARAELADWRTRRWCHARVGRAQVVEIVAAIDPSRAPRTQLVDEARDASRLQIRLFEDFQAGRDADNRRVSRAAASAHSKLAGVFYSRIHDPEVGELGAGIGVTAASVRDAIDAAYHALIADCPSHAGSSFRHSFASPLYAFEHRARAHLLGVEDASPYMAVCELYLAGCYPIGYVDDHFVVFAP